MWVSLPTGVVIHSNDRVVDRAGVHSQPSLRVTEGSADDVNDHIVTYMLSLHLQAGTPQKTGSLIA